MRQKQTAYDEAHIWSPLKPLRDRIHEAMYAYLTDDLGLSHVVGTARSDAETQGLIACAICDECEHAGLCFNGRVVLDLGAGLGALSVELARRGAHVIAIEPGAAWLKLAAERLAEMKTGIALAAVGERLPFADNSFDIVFTHQVLEHVQIPAQVISEAYRVLKPGGYIYASYENYLSFWEPHYRVRWVPLLPKWLGVIYLRILGRNPRFLREAITYTTFPSVRRHFLGFGFECMYQRRFQQTLRLKSKNNLKWRLLKSMNERTSLKLLTGVDYFRRMFRTGVTEFMQKPFK